MTSPITTMAPIAGLEAHIKQLIDDLDTARAEGAVWTYTLIQERLRQGLERHAAQTVTPEWDEIYAIVQDLVRDKGNVVYEWPDDEAAVYRDNDGTVREGMGAVEDLRAEKGTRAVLAILHGKTDREVRADERSKIARSLRNMRTTDDGKPVAAFLNVADWLDTLEDITPAVGQNQDVTAEDTASAI